MPVLNLRQFFTSQYEGNFKQTINHTRHSVRSLSREYNLSEATIYKRKNLYLPNRFTESTGKVATELRKCSFERRIRSLKKAADLFSQKT